MIWGIVTVCKMIEIHFPKVKKGLITIFAENQVEELPQNLRCSPPYHLALIVEEASHIGYF